MKPTAPGSLSHMFAFAIYFFLAFIFRSIKPKNTKIPCCNLFVPRSIYPIYNFYLMLFAYLEAPYPKGIDNPFNTSVARFCYLCAGAVYVVLLGSPTGSITLVSYLREILTLLCCITLSSSRENQHSAQEVASTSEMLAPVYRWIAGACTAC